MNSNDKQRFMTTRWSLILAAAGDTEDAASRAALESLCAAYWYPLYAYNRRARRSHDDALELTQGFFTRMLERRDLSSVSPEGGKFRSFLLSSMQNFAIDEWKRHSAEKRGGGAAAVSLDAEDAKSRYEAEAGPGRSPDREFERQWAATVVDRAMRRLREDMAGSGQLEQYRLLAPILDGSEKRLTYREIADRLETSEGAIKMAVRRMRQRLGTLLREEVAPLVAKDDDVDDEIRFLLAALRDR